ncbi:MAG TPA: hypothetical protein VMO47_16265 [Rhodothermales bacterium]|nr:hypothetical protein [Rhodothermales bacterium]
MSLKSFHIFFIVVSILTTLGFGLWTVVRSSQGDTSANFWLGVISLLAGVFLIWYGFRFFKKLNQLG